MTAVRAAPLLLLGIVACACVDFDALLDDCIARGGCADGSTPADAGDAGDVKDAGAPDAGDGDAGICTPGCDAACTLARPDGGYGQYVSAAVSSGLCTGDKCMSEDCGPYVCRDSPLACVTQCVSPADCLASSWCNPAHQCVQREALDDKCGDPEECLSRRCTIRGTVKLCSECATNADCITKAPVCDVDAGRCVSCTADAECGDAGFGGTCLGNGACQCSAMICSNSRAPACIGSVCACGSHAACMLGQACSDAGTCLLLPKQPCVAPEQCLSKLCSMANGSCM